MVHLGGILGMLALVEFVKIVLMVFSFFPICKDFHTNNLMEALAIFGGF